MKAVLCSLCAPAVWRRGGLLALLPALALAPPAAPVWRSAFGAADWQAHWQMPDLPRMGIAENVAVVSDDSRADGAFIRVTYPKGTWSPAATKKAGLPVGGAQFYGRVFAQPVAAATLTYFIRFPKDFDFVKGGKLPGLYGGTGNTGDHNPTGFDGFTTRQMWREGGRGIGYPFLPDSPGKGTTMQCLPKPLFQADGRWHEVKQEVKLNTIGKFDGSLALYYDGRLAANATGLTFRSTPALGIDGVLFQTFFGGATDEWATPVETHVDFADFAVQVP